MLSLPFYTLVFTSAKNMSKRCSAAKSGENNVVGERSIKAAEKDPSARLTGATLVRSINVSEFW